MAGFIGVLGEDESDAEAVRRLYRRLRAAAGLAPIKIKHFGYGGSGELFRKGHAQLKAWEKAGCVRAVVCHDADRGDPAARKLRVMQDVIGKSGAAIPCCALVPVQEFEAWILADAEKLANLFDWCRGLKQPNHPETIRDPKEHLRELTRNPKTKRYEYHPPTHNPFMADQLGPDTVASRCPSFVTPVQFVGDEVPG